MHGLDEHITGHWGEDQHHDERRAQDTMTVTIPACEVHEGIFSVTVKIATTCPKCGGPRGETYKGFSYDGSRRLVVDCWKNPCGHVDYYEDVRNEVRAARQA